MHHFASRKSDGGLGGRERVRRPRPHKGTNRGASARLTRTKPAARLTADTKDMPRLLRQTLVVLLIVLWNSAGVYATVCEAQCAAGDCPQAVETAARGPNAQSRVLQTGPANAPRHPDSDCPARLASAKCVANSSQLPIQTEISRAQLPLAGIAPAATALAATAGFRTHSPPGFRAGRSLLRNLTLLRV